MKNKRDKTDDHHSTWVSIIGAVTSKLKLTALFALIIEAVLGVTAVNSDHLIQIISILCMSGIFIFLIFAIWFKHDEPTSRVSNTKLENFKSKIIGHWWEMIAPFSPETSCVSHVQILSDNATGTVKLCGKSYNAEGSHAANWESNACCLNLNEKKLFFKWSGIHPSSPNEPFEGFGEITFLENKNVIDRGSGTFIDVNITNLKATNTKVIEFQKCSKLDVETLLSNENEAISMLIKSKLNQKKAKVLSSM